MWTDGLPDPERPGWRTRVCRDCGAGWVGHVDDGPDWCPWCERANERQLVDQRALLLRPAWLESSVGNPRYDALDDVSRAVWDHTRGQRRGTDAVESWVRRLGRAIEGGLITRAEAEDAIGRLE